VGAGVAALDGGGPTGTPLPDKKLLLFILDRLQKKDTYGVFSEPVDPEELPDYHEIIEHPMDFSTIREKLLNDSYSNLEQFEVYVWLFHLLVPSGCVEVSVLPAFIWIFDLTGVWYNLLHCTTVFVVQFTGLTMSLLFPCIINLPLFFPI